MKPEEIETAQDKTLLVPTAHPYIKAKARPPLRNTVVGVASVVFGGANAQAQESTNNLSLEEIEVAAGQSAGSSYNPRSTGTDRLPETILNTAQTINVVPQQLMRDQQTTTLVEALRNVPGITMNSAEGGTQGDNINIRGFSARNDIYRDGMREPAWYTRDAFSIETVDVYKGPSSFIFGRGSTGGVVNMVSKLPLFTNFTELNIAGNTAPGVRGTIDVNRAYGDIAARIVILGTDWDTAGRNFVGTKRVGAMPSIKFRFTEQTNLTLSYIYQRDDNVPDYGIPIIPGSYFGTSYGQPAPVPRSTYYGQQTSGFADTEKVDAHVITAKLEHEFNKDWYVTNTTRFSLVDRFLRARAPQWNSTGANYSCAVGSCSLSSLAGQPLYGLWNSDNNHFQNRTINSMVGNLTNVIGHAETLGLKHTLQAGLDLSKESRYNKREATNSTSAANTNDRINLLYPDAFPTDNVFGPNSTYTRTDARDIGIYVSDQIRFNEYFEMKGGFRYDFYKAWQNTYNINNSTGALGLNGTTPYNLSSTTNFSSWNGSVLFHPSQNSTLYFQYGTSANPLAEYTTITNGQQNISSPTENETYEVGGKIDLLDNKLSLTAAAFTITQKNAVETIDANTSPATVALVGTTRVKGFELGATGEVLPGWMVYTGYTFLDGRLLNSVATPQYVGHTIQNLPRNQVTFSTTYAITPEWRVGTSVYFVDARWNNVANTQRVPGYYRWDLMTAYQVTENFSLQANIFNVLDTTNYESIAGAGFAVPGVGRSAMLTARLRW